MTFQFFPDKAAALREVRRMLAPAGRVAMSVWRTTGAYNSAVGRALAQRLGADVAARFCRTREVPGQLAGPAVVAQVEELQATP